jgi:hypothetical protein
VTGTVGQAAQLDDAARAQAERDCVDLHLALAESIRRLRLAQWPSDDLLAVLERTSEPESAGAIARCRHAVAHDQSETPASREAWWARFADRRLQ